MVEVSGAVALLALRAFFVHFLEWSVTKYLIQNYEEDKNAKFIVNVLQRQVCEAHTYRNTKYLINNNKPHASVKHTHTHTQL